MPDPGSDLLALARWAIASRLGEMAPEPVATPSLSLPGACFVTLNKRGMLRGCIGSLEAHRSLHDDIVENARAAAFRDPRFPPMQPAEWPEVDVEVSVLSAPQDFPVDSETDALQKMRPGVDGIVLQDLGRRATFLPQVWESLPEPAQFLRALKQKAGLPPDHWSPQLRLQRYTVQKWTA